MITRKEIQVSYPGQTCSLYGVAIDKILAIKKEGLGLKVETPGSTSTAADYEGFTFEYRGTKPFTSPAGFAFYQSSNSIPYPPGTTRYQFFYIGDGVVENVVYRFSFNGTTADYLTPASPTQASVAAGICAMINGIGWGVTVIASPSTGNRISIAVVSTSPVHQFAAIAMTNAEYTFISGLYVEVDGLQYLIEANQSYASMPAVPTPSDPYNIGDLTAFDLYTYLSDPLYSWDTLATTSIGNLSIVNEVFASLYPSTGDTVNVQDGTMYFANQFSTFETIIMLHK